MRRYSDAILLALAPLLIGCGGGSASPVDDTKPARVGAIAGDGQTAIAQTTVLIAPAVIITDAKNRPVAGIPVMFAVGTGGGSVQGGSVSTDASGRAQAGAWRLGPQLGIQSTVASTPSIPSLAGVIFTARAISGPPALMAIVGGDNQTGARGSTLPLALAVTVRDAIGNPAVGVTVNFQPNEANSTATPSAVITDSTGTAGGVRWKVGTSCAGFVTGLSASAGNAIAFFRANYSTGGC